MNPLRWDVLAVAFVLALPLLGLGLRGDFTAEEVTLRLPWCLVAGWAVVALLRFALAPPKPAGARAGDAPSTDEDVAPSTDDGEPASA